MVKTPTKRSRQRGDYMIYSTLTGGTDIVEYDMSNKDIPRVKYRVSINGGAGLSNSKTLITPFGVSTPVTTEQMDFLEAQPEYQRLVKEGWMKAIKVSGWMDDPDDIADEMSQRDGSAPIVMNDFISAGMPTPNIGKGGYSVTSLPRTNPLPLVRSNFKD